ncbi:ATP-binding protein [Actinorugispora endophytica]|uniref:histidine kinase n=1 Tax=Actinorugispora endophytica TaxID=1605990 RepID=A0A4R6UJ23_9ACTN|nr:ATP-binding protein [Actinorugispora endophytica]TDQ46908.1 cyclic nucleotide-binding protein [Actinorugispora endophytica]
MTTTPPHGRALAATDLHGVELFSGLETDQYEWLASAGVAADLADGEVLFRDGERADWFCVLISGGLVITTVVDGREEVLTRHVAGEGHGARENGDKPSAAHGFTGEMPLLIGGDYVATATAVGRSLVARYDRDAFLEMMVRCPRVTRTLIPVLAWRIHSSEVQAGQRGRLNALGTLAAGIAHELNNPAAAMARSSADLAAALPQLEERAQAWGAAASEAERAAVAAAREEILGRPPASGPRDALDAAEVEDEVSDWLDGHGLARAWRLASAVVDRGLDADWLDALARGMRSETVVPALEYLDVSLAAANLAGEAGEAGARVSALVGAVKEYTNLDRAPEQEVDLVQGLESTLAILRRKLSGVAVSRDYQPDVPVVLGYPGELNQVWTNLIDNAVDAMEGGGSPPELGVVVRLEGTCAVVEIADNGPGVPSDVLPRVFEPFFTTKDVGKGTGLGLHLSHRIVAQRHNGSIQVRSAPGDTRFIVRIPADGPGPGRVCRLPDTPGR